MSIEALKRTGVDVIGRFVELKPEGGHHKGRCPFHDDSTPSFIVYPDGKGFHCFGCDANGDVIDFIQRQEGVDFQEAKRRVSEMTGIAVDDWPKQQQAIAGRVVESYPYVDERGELLYEVLRYEPKSFKQRRPEGGSWTWGIGDSRRPLYRLPAVLKADEVFVVEGEKDVATLERLGLTATTNSGGASQGWREEWTETLRGKRAIIIPDGDEPGRKHGEKIRAAIAGSAAEAVVVNLPGDGKDVTDFVARGGTAADLRRLIGEARAAAAEAARPWWERIPTLANLKPEPVRWLIPGLIPDGGFVLMAGTPGSYKSFLALDIARAVATGQHFAGFGAPLQREVLYVDLENPLNVIATRKEYLGIVNAERLRYWGRWAKTPFFGIDATELRDYAKAIKPLIVFDSLVRFHRSNENDNSEMAAVMANFLALTSAGATVLLLHHAGKEAGKNVRGAIEIEGAPDLAYRVSREGDRQIQLFQFKNRFAEETMFELTLSEYGFQGERG